MRNKKTLLMLVTGMLAIGSQSPVNGQENPEKLLKNYVLPDIKRHSLDLGFSSDGYFTTTTTDDTNKESISGYIEGRYNYYKNTRKFIGRQSLDFSFGSSYKRESEKDIKEGSLRPHLLYANSSRFYNPSNLLFFETGGDLNYSYSRYFGDDYSYFTLLRAAIPLQIGVGRIEDAREMRQALYMINKLKKNGVITNTLSDHTVSEFAQLLSTVKNKRFLDHRKRLISEISSIDSFLVDNKIIKENGAKYFTTLYDYWLYGDLFERKSGTEWKVGITPGVQYNPSKSSTYKNKYESFDLLANLKFSYENPINLYWQQSSMINLTGGFKKKWYTTSYTGYEDQRIKYKNNFHTNFMDITANYYISYYPNSRTQLRTGISEYFLYEKLTDMYGREPSEYNLTVTKLHFDAYYYVSPQLRVTASANLGYMNRSKEYSNYWDYSFPYSTGYYSSWIGDFGISLTYSLF